MIAAQHKGGCTGQAQVKKQPMQCALMTTPSAMNGHSGFVTVQPLTHYSTSLCDTVPANDSTSIARHHGAHCAVTIPVRCWRFVDRL
jgi:hypothetical protein